MPMLSVITAAYAPKAAFLAETAESLADQKLPDDWEFEWLVQEDGAEPALESVVGRVAGVRYAANGTQAGIAGTRNLALARARGELVRVLDHDDVLLDGALANPLTRLADEPALGWVMTAAGEIDETGVRSGGAAPARTGSVPRGTVGAVTDVGGSWSQMCAGLTARTDLVRALGGWMAAPRSEDVGLMTALAELSDGYVDDEVGWLYRRHRAQTHLEADWQARGDAAVRMIDQRLAALRSTGMSVRSA
ncbi:hypothetical protein BJF85_11065 [Saccharomonospora sp. CUA-673]|uniref:glycosyltransferase n=1 Tax=Saccharomonospora sp. CUA-673 TaxID=1904969 RepID=UPI0009634662|nr:glycosyltransferase [Saccharomonospora sp. CUA-673]OLT48979.1 hypothetical protein BJF85_11065 [Saccharomonospora sp. CUA-673]